MMTLLSILLFAAQDAPAKPAMVPFQMLPTQHMLVEIKINGKGPYKVVFDTGAPVSIINRKVAKESGLISPGSSTPLFGLLGPTPQASIKSLELGTVEAKDVPIIVMDHPTVSIMSQAFGGIEGILGFPFFARYRMTLNYQSKQLLFVANGYEPGDVLQRLMNTVMARDASAAKVLASTGLIGIVVHRQADDELPGVVVSEVYPGSPAAQAGLLKGDRLLSLDDRWTDSVQDCHEAASLMQATGAVEARVKRDNQTLLLKLSPKPGL